MESFLNVFVVHNIQYISTFQIVCNCFQGDLHVRTDHAHCEAMRSQIEELEKQNQQLRDVNTMTSERLARIERDNKQLSDRDVVSRKEYRRYGIPLVTSRLKTRHVSANCFRLEMELRDADDSVSHLRIQNEKLEEMYQKMLTDRDLSVSTRGKLPSKHLPLRSCLCWNID